MNNKFAITEDQKVSLDNLAGGAAVERFNVELEKALENVLDPNMEATKTRSVTLKVSFKPNKNRNFASVKIDTSSTLANLESYESDGGAWKMSAIERIKLWLEEQLGTSAKIIA